jgi:hypothetical protein
MDMIARFIYKSFQIDTNRINARGGLEHMNQLERWRDEDVIHLDMSEVAHGEARSGNDARRSEKALGYIYSITHADTSAEQAQMRAIESILFPNGPANQNERNDVEIVFNALKYSRILVTNDGASKTQPGGIIGKRNELAALGLRIMRDFEAVEYIKSEIRRRDELARRIADHTGQPLPEWVGKD